MKQYVIWLACIGSAVGFGLSAAVIPSQPRQIIAMSKCTKSCDQQDDDGKQQDKDDDSSCTECSSKNDAAAAAASQVTGKRRSAAQKVLYGK